MFLIFKTSIYNIHDYFLLSQWNLVPCTANKAKKTQEEKQRS